MAKGVTTVLYEDFSAGIDQSRGPMARDARRFSQLDNFLITDAQRLKRRPPCEKIAGAQDAGTQGMLYLNGQFVTVAKAGTAVTHTFASPAITTLYFDNPEHCTGWQLIDLLSLNETVVAVIRHQFSGVLVSSRVMIHVWDGQRPTWVDDPAAPTNWSKSFPLHAYGAGALGAFKDYRPTIATSSDKLFCTLPDGNLAFSATNRPRVWTDRTAADILANGRWFYWITPGAMGAQQVALPIPYTDLTTAGTYAAYVVERCQADGTWTQLVEIAAGPPAVGQCCILSTVNRFDAAKPNEATVQYRVDLADAVLRIRLLARPAVTASVGAYLVPAGVITSGTLALEGASENYPMTSLVVPPLAATTDYLVQAVSSRKPAAVTIPTAIAGTTTTMPLNGQQRYWSRTVAAARTGGGGTSFSFDYTGTVGVSANSALIVGAATVFLAQGRVGDEVEVNGEKRIIAFIRSDTLMEVTEPFTATAAGVPMTRDVRYRYAYQIGEVGNPWYATREAEATFTLAGSGDAGTLNSSLYDNSGDVPLLLMPGQNRLFVLYRTATQLWQTDQDPVNTRLLSVAAVGAGTNGAPRGAVIDGFAVMPTHTGPRMFSPDGLGKDYIKMAPIGDVLRTEDLPQFTAACWWGRARVLLFASNADPRMYAFSYHPDSKVGGWSVWTVTGLSGVDRVFVTDDDLYISRNRELWRFNIAGTVFKDSTDGATAYASTAKWLYNDLGSPGRNKHLVRFEIAQEGQAQVAIFVDPSDQSGFAPGPLVEGLTMGHTKSALAALAPAVALRIQTTDQRGYDLFSIGFDYKLTGR